MGQESTLAQQRALEQALFVIEKLEANERARAEPIAIVGMGCRFPGAEDPEAFWRLLHQGQEAVGPIPADRWDVESYFDPDPERPGKMYTRSGSFLKHVDQFDPLFFGISPREAASLDPQQRLMLEVCWEAFENAAQVPSRLAGNRIGTFVSIGQSDYALFQLLSPDPTRITAWAGTGSGLSFAAGRLSHALGLQGPSLVVDTACSSSLVAVHLAIQSLRNGECRLALAGGVQLILAPEVMLFLSRARALSPDGRCKTFDASADGYGRGEGCGAVVLKRLSDALQDEDEILAVIRGSAVNHDGPSSGLTVPNGLAQQALIRQALEIARVAPSEVSYVEAHGTGTRLGDPIEFEALGAVFGPAHSPEQPLWVGSVKTNIGHLEPAAGIASLIKVALALRHGEIPPHPSFERPSEHIPWDRFPLRVPTSPIPWDRRGKRIAGISAFGLSGTNAHLVLEEAPARPARPVPTPRASLLMLSARSPEALDQLAERFQHHLIAHPELSAHDVCYSASTGRAHFPYRRAVVGASAAELAQELARRASRNGSPPEQSAHLTGDGRDEPRRLLSSLGALYERGGEVSWASLPDAAKGRRVPLPTYPFQRMRYWCDPPTRPAARPASSVASPIPGRRVHSPLIGQTLFESRIGVEELPFLKDHIVFGEVTVPGASHLAHVLAISGQVHGGRGSVLEHVSFPQALVLPEGRIRDLQVVLSPEGTARDSFTVLTLEPDADGARVEWTSHATGRARAASAHDTDGAALERLPLAELRAGFTEALDPGSFFSSIRRRGIDLGPGFQWHRALWRRGQEALGRMEVPEALTPEERYPLHPALLDSCFQLLLAALTPDASGELPTFVPFSIERLRLHGRPTHFPLWCHVRLRRAESRTEETLVGDIRLVDARGQEIAEVDGFVGRRVSPELLHGLQGRERDWLHEMTWEPAEPSPRPASPREPGRWLILADPGGVGLRLAEELRARGEACVLLFERAGPHTEGPDRLVLDLSEPRSAEQLLQRLVREHAPRGLVHLWSLDAHVDETTSSDTLRELHLRGCGSVLQLLRLLVAGEGVSPPRLWLGTCGAQVVGATRSPVEPAQASVWGLGRVLALEHPELRCVRFDLGPTRTREDLTALALALVEPDEEEEFALREGMRYVARLSPVAPAAGARTVELRPEAGYLVTGGLGALGLHVARWLVERGARHLALVGRRASSPTAEQRQGLDALEAAGATVLLLEADLSRPDAVQDLFTRLADSFPPLRGVVHAAGINDDGVLLQLPWERFERALAPKVMGSWLLHAATRSMPLDFFACFSSAAALLGSAGQGNYAAANAFLDGLVAYRHSLGLPGLGINWGPWAGAGMAANLGVRDRARWEHLDIRALTPAEGMRAFEVLLASERAQVAVLPRQRRSLPAHGDAPPPPRWLSRFVRTAPAPQGPSPAQPTRTLEARLAGLSPEEAERDLLEVLQAEAARVLGLSAGQAAPTDQSLFELGLDSLMALELRNHLQARAGKPLSSTLLFDHPSINDLMAHLKERLFTPRSPAASTVPQQVSKTAPAPREDVAQLSEGELEALLLKKIASLERKR
ncbi:SDR family NAD(P)-dependent oxidoreductase [Corallococcus silvisoli]|uniref:SDR family NAD(P)-dependent oxidoreductase n=1 Tax=Corallococcus silvisoli TaxID=2697031 RepID=UPI0013783C3E|nr:SDR family NAD(P)-dependent oxidoreductase [Corallococcus silvisoli]NBD13836.1 SDR family NAD(P)-dependent oxidoreductase [Corallococcus silvisoli]